VEDNLPGVLDGIDEPVTVEQLEEVVRRADQRRRATLVAGAAALLALGALGGAIARGPSDDQPLAFGGGDEATTSQSARGWATDMPFGGTTEKYVSLFRREANGVAVRAYRMAGPPPPPGVDPACAGPTSVVQAQLSTAAAVGLLFAPEPADAAKPQGTELKVLAADSFGMREGAPATTAVVRTGPGVATVRITTPSGSDTMAPEEGIAVLAVAGLADGGNVEGLAPDGAVVASEPIIPPPPSGEQALASKVMEAKSCAASTCLDAYSAAGEPPPPPVTTIVGSGSTGQLADPGPDRIEIDPACGKIIGGGGGIVNGPTATASGPDATAVAPSQPDATPNAPAPASTVSPGGGSVGAAGSTTTVTGSTSAAAPSAAP